MSEASWSLEVATLEDGQIDPTPEVAWYQALGVLFSTAGHFTVAIGSRPETIPPAVLSVDGLHLHIQPTNAGALKVGLGDSRRGPSFVVKPNHTYTGKELDRLMERACVLILDNAESKQPPPPHPTQGQLFDA